MCRLRHPGTTGGGTRDREGCMPKILTLTINPAVDIAWEAEDIVPIRKLRSESGKVYPGGGGITVSNAIAALGGETLAIFPRGGITGELLTELLDDYAIDRRVVKIAGHTRLNATIYERSTSREYRIVPPGPELQEHEWQACLDLVSQIPSEYLVCAGSLARGVPYDFYGRVAATARKKGTKVILDTSGRALFEAMKVGVFLVKPNLRELENLVGRKAPTPAKQEEIARELVETGKAEVVALTLGNEGALLVWRDGAKRLPSPDVEVASRVGAGSSFTGGLTLAIAQGKPFDEALTLAVAAGAAALMTVGTELCRRPDVDRLCAELLG